MTGRGVVGFIVLLGVAAGTAYLSQSLSDDDEEVETTPALQSGFYLRAARFLGTGADGQPLYRVEAEYAEQRGDQMIEFQNVRINYSPVSGVPWTVAADTATITQNQELLMLEGHVVATSSEGFEGRVTEIRAPYLELEPERSIAETDTRVQIRIGSRSLTATGMLASLRDNHVTLKSNVSGKFVP